MIIVNRNFYRLKRGGDDYLICMIVFRVEQFFIPAGEDRALH